MHPEPPDDVEAYLRKRLPGVLAVGFQPKMSPEDHRALMREFIGTLVDFPIWALAEACDSWVRQMSRSPSPADLANRAEKAHKRERENLIRAELDHAEVLAPARQPSPPPPSISEQTEEERQEFAERILRQAGFTKEKSELIKRFPAARSVTEAEDMQARKSAFRAQPSPEELRRIRDANPLVQQARAAQKRGEQ